MAFLFGRGGKLISMAVNKIGTRSMGAGYSDCSLHAERAVLKRIGDTTKLFGLTMVVVRITSQGDLAGSKPCQECQRHLEKCMRVHGLQKVYYS